MKLSKGKRLKSAMLRGLSPAGCLVYFSVASQHGFESPEKGGRNVAPTGVLSLLLDTAIWIQERSVPLAGLRTPSHLGCWRNGFKRPVLKHGPRSLTYVRVFGWQTHERNESECRWDPQGAPSTGPDLLGWIRVRAYMLGPERW